jgi:uncharacterized protein YehS (DUF1456 family)
MTNNYILRNIRYALNLDDSTMLEIFRLGGHDIDPETLSALLQKEDEQGHIACSSKLMGSFLDGLIVHRRGRKETRPESVKPPGALTNNDILKKLRIALELKEDDMLAILKAGDVEISKSELTALFRKKGHKHYKECGDQFLRYFLKGLTVRDGR